MAGYGAVEIYESVEMDGVCREWPTSPSCCVVQVIIFLLEPSKMFEILVLQLQANPPTQRWY